MIWEKLAKIDRRWLFLFEAIVLILAIILGKTMTMKPAPETKKLFNFVENLPENKKVVLISTDYDAASMPELQPFLRAFLTHCFKKKIKVLLMGHWPAGVPIGMEALENVAKKMGAKYGEDYLALGFRPGITAVIVGIGKEIRDVFKVDYKYSKPIDEYPIMRGIHTYDNIGLVIGLEAGAVGESWIALAWGRFKANVAIASTAVVASDYYAYLQANQIVGLAGGLKGAADYEYLVWKKYGVGKGWGLKAMIAQSAAQLYIILMLLLGNLGYIMVTRRRKK